MFHHGGACSRPSALSVEFIIFLFVLPQISQWGTPVQKAGASTIGEKDQARLAHLSVHSYRNFTAKGSSLISPLALPAGAKVF
jgi:hypothetical protein